jgi:hypothetical protein
VRVVHVAGGRKSFWL